MKQLTIAALLLLLLQACQKDKTNQTPASATSVEYLPMKIGNYWAYKVTTEQGVYPNTNVVVTHDTMRIVSDTVIDGNTYYMFNGGGSQLIYNNTLLRDSAGFIVYYGGGRYPLSLIANDTLAAYTADNGFDYRVYRSGNLDTAITVPAGGFQTVESVMDFYYLQGSPPPTVSNPRPVLGYYAKNVGLVKCVGWYASGSGNMVSELEGYYIQP